MASIDFDVEDYLDEASASDLFNELVGRDDFSLKLKGTELHDFLVKLFNVSPCLNNEELLKEIKERLQ